jgi:predicted RNA-binding protein with EMAP domain
VCTTKVQESSQVTIQGLEYYIRSNTKLELVIHEMIDLVSRVENIHDQYEEYVEHYKEIERDTLENFARGVIEDSALSVKGMLPRIQRLVGGPAGNEFRVLGNRGLLELMANDMKVSFESISQLSKKQELLLHKVFANSWES